MVKPDAARNYYADLEIPSNANADDIRKAFRRLALTYHPDRNPGKESEFVAKFQSIQTAQEVLIDPVQRAKYDAERRKYKALNIPLFNPPRSARPPPPPRNTYTTTAAGGSYSHSYRPQAPPPRPPPPQTRPPRQEQYKPTGPSVPNGADRFKNFPRPPPTFHGPTTQKRDAEDRANVFTAWQNMQQRQKKAEEGFAKARRDESKPFERTQSTRQPRRAGFDPTMPGADEPQAPGSAYRSAYERPDPSPPVTADPLRHFKTQMEEEPHIPFSEGQPRMRTPYTAAKGERTSMYSNEELRRSASTRTSPNRPESSENGGFYSDSGRTSRSRQRKSYGGNATRPFSMYSSTDESESDDVEEIPAPSRPKMPHQKTAHHWQNWKQPGEGTPQPNGAAGPSAPPNGHPSEGDKANLGGFKSRSAESINLKFSPSDWHGKFEGNPDYFAPHPAPTSSGRAKQSPTRGRSASNRPPPKSSTNTPFFPPPPAFPPPKSSQMPPPPPPPPRLNTQAGPASGPHSAKFTPDEWKETFKESNWAYPNKEPSPSRTASNATRRARTASQRKTSTIPPGTPVVDLTADSPNISSEKVKTSRPHHQAFTEEASDESSDAMDIDSNTPTNGQTKGPPQTAQSVPTSPHDIRNGTIPKAPATAPTSTTEPVGPGFDGLGSLRNVAPFAASTEAAGLNELNDMKSSLPFDSQPSTTHPTKPTVAQKLKLPLMPKPPSIPNPLTASSFDNYMRHFHLYVSGFRKFNNEMLSHFVAREAELETLDRGWLVNKGETTEGMGFESYCRTLEEDEHARHHWMVGCERHQRAMGECEEVRKKAPRR